MTIHAASLLSELEAQQDEVIAQLDDLNRRIESLLNSLREIDRTGDLANQHVPPQPSRQSSVPTIQPTRLGDGA